MYIDTHTHYNIILEETPVSTEDLFARQKKAGIKKTVHICIDEPGLIWARDFAAAHTREHVFFSLGIHPSSEASERELAQLRLHAEETTKSDIANQLFGIGECGLDYYRMRKPAEMQKKSFEFQIDLADRLGVPVIVHSRDAIDDTLDIIKACRPARGIMHCFSGDAKTAKKVLDLGFYISFAGNITYNKAVHLHESAAYVPDDRLLLETDAPFLTPIPLRGKKNLPEYIVHTYSFIAGLRNIDTEKLQSIIENNFNRITVERRPNTVL